MTQMPSKVVDVVSALETLKLPYVLYREESGAHRVLIAASSDVAVLRALSEALGPEAIDGIEVVSAEDDTIAEVSGAGASSSCIVIEVRPGNGDALVVSIAGRIEGRSSGRARGHQTFYPAGDRLAFPQRRS